MTTREQCERALPEDMESYEQQRPRLADALEAATESYRHKFRSGCDECSLGLSCDELHRLVSIQGAALRALGIGAP